LSIIVYNFSKLSFIGNYSKLGHFTKFYSSFSAYGGFGGREGMVKFPGASLGNEGPGLALGFNTIYFPKIIARILY